MTANEKKGAIAHPKFLAVQKMLKHIFPVREI